MSSQTGWVETRDTTGARPAPRRFSWSWLGVVPFFLFAFAFLIYPAASLFVSASFDPCVTLVPSANSRSISFIRTVSKNPT